MSIAFETIRSVLAIYAHPDDAEAAAGGTLARCIDAGATAHVVICAQGDKGSDDPAVDPGALVARRRDEALAAAGALGVAQTTFLDHPDGELDARDREFQADLVRIIREAAPELVLAPDPTAVFFGDSYINHRDHREVGWAVLDAVAPAAGSPHYFAEQIATGLVPHTVELLLLSGTLEPNEFVDIEPVIERKIDALFCHRSQLGDLDTQFREFLRRRAAEVGRGAGLAAAEAFRRVTFAT